MVNCINRRVRRDTVEFLDIKRHGQTAVSRINVCLLFRAAKIGVTAVPSQCFGDFFIEFVNIPHFFLRDGAADFFVIVDISRIEAECRYR